ncbi:ATP-dependent helicase HrpB [Boudabousia marimammalium]|uniref:RNA helicase n=1 Tax=Boudabousia marimammalium TaxID=156892 RepID=A0A1Q5PM39_9ACTO|nr:ATP-dependent helicase HrpB [Boudabousia marimammalium]
MLALHDLLASPPDLPVVAGLSEVRGALDTHHTLVVSAPPGTGKTTLLPPLLADLLAGTRVIVTQPRRIAARTAATRLSALLGQPVGKTIGYSVRGDTKNSAATLIEFVTPGVLLRRLQNDPELNGVGAVIIDEVHERNLDSDLAVAFLNDVRQLREDLYLVAMSATVAAQTVAPILGDGTPIVEIPGLIHPVTVVEAPPGRGQQALGTVSRWGQIGVRPEFLQHVTDTTLRALAETSGDILVFLPGVKELESVAANLRTTQAGCEVLPLHGGLSAAQQDHIYQPHTVRRVIVSTAVAESSITVPGVRVVVDACLSREPRIDLARGLSSLVTVGASRAACTQRAGRAGREAAGTVYRCVDAATWAGMREHTEPEITHSDLTGLALHCAAWGAPGGQGLNWLTDPPAPALQAAERTLDSLGATNAGQITALGRALATLPLSPRWGRALIEASPWIGARLAAQAIATADATVRAEGADGVALWKSLARGGGNPAAASQWKQQWQRLEKQAQQWSGEIVPSPTTQQTARQGETTRDEALATVIALAYPDRLARQRAKDSPNYLLAGGVGGQLPEHSPLRGQEWLAVADLLHLQGRSDALISLAAPIPADLALELGASLRQDIPQVEVTERGKVRVLLNRQLGQITLQQVVEKQPQRDLVEQAIRRYLTEHGWGALEQSPAAKQLLSRLSFLHAQLRAPWPDVSETALLARLDEWLGPELAQAVKAGKLPKVTAAAVQALLPWPEASRLDELAPEQIQVPTGRQIPVDYSDGQPRIRVQLQQCFGWTDSPTLADGRVPLTIELLSPAQRPLAITADLHSFWTGPYAGVRAEMRGRYPKHPWPEDPLTATATTHAKRRR